MKNNREDFVNFRVNQLEKQAIEVLCDREQIKISELMRNLVREGLQKHGVDLVTISEFVSGKSQITIT